MTPLSQCHVAYIYFFSSLMILTFFISHTGVPNEVCLFILFMPISSPGTVFDRLLELSHREDSNWWLGVGFCGGIWRVMWFEVNFAHPIWSSVVLSTDFC